MEELKAFMKEVFCKAILFLIISVSAFSGRYKDALVNRMSDLRRSVFATVNEGNDFDREIKFVAKVDGVTVEHNYVEWNDSYFYPIETGFIIKSQKNVVYSFMGIVPEGIPEARLIISYKGEQKVVRIDWGLETGENGENLDYYDVYF